MSAFLRMLACLVFALFVAASWATPSEAHAGHDGPPAAAQSQQPSSLDDMSKRAAADRSIPSVAGSADDADCQGHGATGNSRCCSSVCHAAMSEELGVLTPLLIEATAAPSSPEPTAQVGPTLYIKRPPRPLAATVG